MEAPHGAGTGKDLVIRLSASGRRLQGHFAPISTSSVKCFEKALHNFPPSSAGTTDLAFPLRIPDHSLLLQSVRRGPVDPLPRTGHTAISMGAQVHQASTVPSTFSSSYFMTVCPPISPYEPAPEAVEALPPKDPLNPMTKPRS